MKRLVALFMAITLVMLFSACTSETPGEPADDGQKFPTVLFSDDSYTLTALSYGLDSFGDYGLELKLENRTEAKANLNYDGYMIANGYALTGSVNINTEPGETETGWLNLNEEEMEIRGLSAADIVELKVRFEVYLPDTGDYAGLGDDYSTVRFGAYSEDKIPAATVGNETLVDQDGIVVKLVKSEVDWTGDKAYYFCIENNTAQPVDFSTYSATVNGTAPCTVFCMSNFAIPAGAKTVEDLTIDADDLAEINLTPETVTSITTAFRFISDDDSIDFTTSDITVNG